MSEPRVTTPCTAFRRDYERARVLDPAAQLRECVDHLENPQVLVAELVDAVQVVDALLPPGLAGARPARQDGPGAEPEELVLEYFYASRRIELVGAEPGSFTCAASDFHPLSHLEPDRDDQRDGLDYVGTTLEPEPVVVLGAVESVDDTTPYAVFLRLLVCASECAPEAQLRWLAQHCPKGGLGDPPRLDLHLVLWEGDESGGRSSLVELTRDLAEAVKAVWRDRPELPPILRDIVCLRMNPDDFDGRLHRVWRI